jgi:hypothetical protein
MLLAVVFSLFGSAAALARAESANVEVFRLLGTWIGIKILFPTEISGNFAGTLAGKHFDCITVPTHELYCIGPFRQGMDPSLLTIYDNDTKETVLEKVITSPRGPGKGDDEVQPTPTEAPTPDPTEEPCIECNPA